MILDRLPNLEDLVSILCKMKVILMLNCICQERLGYAPIINNSEISVAEYTYTQMLKHMLMRHVRYGMAGAQLCTLPTLGLRLKEQPLPEMLLFAITEGT